MVRIRKASTHTEEQKYCYKTSVKVIRLMCPVSVNLRMSDVDLHKTKHEEDGSHTRDQEETATRNTRNTKYLNPTNYRGKRRCWNHCYAKVELR